MLVPRLRFFAPLSVVDPSGMPRSTVDGVSSSVLTASILMSARFIPYLSCSTGSFKYMEWASSSVFSLSSDIFLGFWLYPTTNASIEGLVGKGALTADNNFNYGVTKGVDGKLTFSVGFNDVPQTVYSVTTSRAVRLNQWNSFFAFYVAAERLRVYLNGKLTENVVGIPDVLQTNTNAFTFGRLLTGTGYSYSKTDLALPFLSSGFVGSYEAASSYVGWLTNLIDPNLL